MEKVGYRRESRPHKIDVGRDFERKRDLERRKDWRGDEFDG